MFNWVPVGLRWRVCCPQVRFAATIGPLASTAAAMPITQNTIKAECSESGGAYQWYGGGASTCTYRDNEGTLYRDYYLNGVYTRTD